VQSKTLRWLKHHRFYELTGVKLRHVHFCLEREAKAVICRKLRITHFIDDRLDVLLNLKTVSNLYLLQAVDDVNDAELARHSIHRVRNWQEIRVALLG
jgi:hypothetical protein